MDMSEVKAFNAELSGMYDNKPPISKAKMSAITRGAIKAIKFYKHVVHSVEKFIQKCKPEYKVPGLYVIDSIVRQSRHQFGQDKDVFAPRFAKNMQQTFSNLFRCPPEDKRNIIRVLNLWQKNNVFAPEVIQPLMDMADPNHPLHQEIQQQQNNTSNGGSLNVSHATTEGKNSPAPQQHHSPQGPLHSPMGDSFQDQSSQPSNVKFNRKLLNDFEYDSEDDGGTPGAPRAEQPPPAHHQPNPADALGSILTNPEIMRQLQSLQAQMQLMTGMQGIQMPMPMGQDMQQMAQNQNQTLPFLGGQSEPQKQPENKEDGANESDIEFVETGPQVIEIPDANDSRSPSPSRRRRSRSPRRRRRGSRSRSRSPRRRRADRDRDREREREKERERDKEKNNKEREAEKEKQREREKKGLPPIKKDNLSVCSTTLWVGHLSKLATQEELSDLFGGYGGVVSIDVVGPRGCAFVVMERRRDAHKAKAKLDKHKLHSKEITVAWAPGKGVKGREWKDYWEAEFGVSYLPWARLEQLWRIGMLSMDALEEGGAVDEDTLPPWLPPRIMPKTMMDGPPMNAMMGMPPVNPPGMLPNLPNMPNMPNMPPGMPNMPGLGGGLGAAALLGALSGGAPPAGMPLSVPRLPLPGMTPGMPPGIAPGMPPGIRPPSIPSIPAGVPGLQADAALPPAVPLLGFPGGGLGGLGGLGAPLPAGFLGGLLRLGLLPPPPLPHKQQEVTHTDDAMDLDTEENHTNDAPSLDGKPESTPLSLPDQLQALLSKPPPIFNSAEPPPNFNASEPPPAFDASIPPPSDEKPDDDKKERDRDRDRRDRDRDRGRERDGDRRERRDRDRRDRGDRDRDRRDRGGDDRRGDRDRDRDRDRGRDRRDRDRDGNKDRDRFPRENREASREKSPRSAAEQAGEKTLQQRLWEMANGKPDTSAPQSRDGFDIAPRQPGDADDAEPRRDRPPPLLEVPELAKPEDSGWTQLPPPRAGPPHMGPTFRAELRLRGQPRPPIRGPWMDGPGPNFGPRFNGMGPPFRPPFERPPFEGGPMFDGPPRFERPPFSRMPFDGPRPPFDGPRPPFDGPRPPFDGPRPPFDGPRPPFDGPPFDGPPFDGDMPFDGPPRFDGPPDFFDRNNRRFDDREQFDRNWNGNNRERDPDWDNRNDWDDRRQNRDRRSRDQEDRFNRDRGDRRRNFDDRRSNRDDRSSARDDRNPRDEKRDSKEEKTPTKDEKPKEERAPRNRDKDRKSRWGAAEETPQEEPKPAADNQEGPSKEAEVIRDISSQSEQVSTEIPPREDHMESQTTPADNSNKDSNENKEIYNENVGNDKRDNEPVSQSDVQLGFQEQNFSAKEEGPSIDVRLSEINQTGDNSKTADASFSQPEERQPEKEPPFVEKELVFELPESLRSDAVSEEKNEPQDSGNASEENREMEAA